MLPLILLLLVIATTVWVGVDARGRDWPNGKLVINSPVKWVVSMLLCWIVVFPVYLAKRGTAPRIAS